MQYILLERLRSEQQPNSMFEKNFRPIFLCFDKITFVNRVGLPLCLRCVFSRALMATGKQSVLPMPRQAALARLGAIGRVVAV